MKPENDPENFKLSILQNNGFDYDNGLKMSDCKIQCELKYDLYHLTSQNLHRDFMPSIATH